MKKVFYKRGKMKKVFYLCDGEVPECTKTRCYKNNDGPCRHTSNVEHAKNFLPVPGRGKGEALWEGEPSSLQKETCANEGTAQTSIDLLP